MPIACITRRRLALLCVAMAGTELGLGCSSSKPPPMPVAAPPPKPKSLTLVMQATDTVNPDRSGRPSPVVLRIYELKSAASFESTDFVSLYEKEQTVLGADVVARDEFVLQPGEERQLRRDASEARVLACFAAFRDLEHSRWRVWTPLAPGQDHSFTLKVDGATLQLAGQ